MDQVIDKQIAKQIAKKIKELRGYREIHFAIATRLFKPGSPINAIDQLAFASLNRSLQLTFAFCDLIHNEQSLAATPLVRLQLDNALRFSALFLVDDPAELASQVIAGNQLNHMLDRTGAQLTDRHLVKQFEQIQPWVKPIYDYASGFVHLSEMHVFSAMQISDKPHPLPGYFNFSANISQQDVFIPASFRLDLVGAFKASTDLFFGHVNAWADYKENFLNSVSGGLQTA